jgi:hypothetical protein
MGAYKHYFQVNAQGEPLERSNIRTNRPPKSLGRLRWKEFKTQADYCCDDTIVLETGLGRHKRYWVRLDPDTNLPISMTLMKRKIKPDGFWQEVVGIHDCSFANFPAVFTQVMHDDGFSFNLFTELGITGLTLDVVTDEDTDNNDMTVTTTAPGLVTVTQVDPLTDNTDTITLRASNGCTHKLIVVTLEYFNDAPTGNNFTINMDAADDGVTEYDLLTLADAEDDGTTPLTVVETGAIVSTNGDITVNVTAGEAIITIVDPLNPVVADTFDFTISDGVHDTVITVTVNYTP